MLLVFFQFPFVFWTFPDATSNTTSGRECPGVLDFVCHVPSYHFRGGSRFNVVAPRFQLLLCHFSIVQSVKRSNSVHYRHVRLAVMEKVRNAIVRLQSEQSLVQSARGALVIEGHRKSETG
jgi:hypothetical protein